MYHYYAQQGAKSKKLPFHKNNWTPKIDQDLSKIKSCAVKLLPIWSSVSVSIIFGVLLSGGGGPIGPNVVCTCVS